MQIHASPQDSQTGGTQTNRVELAFGNNKVTVFGHRSPKTRVDGHNPT